ncbi:hypothetical protein D0Z08_23620 [Nocardioides immobilis]|uniref:Alpha/beta hydrolase n=1 Tax=Nocardioides immobilis TaxID=2049295 RepID=A0A417XWS8_9ACTN|nr:hypothetical protein [Nocardioides immobilis]RHW24710.1 hypothetical protein D0Z08_23620 [Nocardioides immobilis]
MFGLPSPDRLEQCRGLDRTRSDDDCAGLDCEQIAAGRALALALGWEPSGPHLRTLGLKLAVGRQMLLTAKPLLPFLLSSPTGRRATLKLAVQHGDRMSPEAALDLTNGLIHCTVARPLRQWFLTTEHTLGAIDCPVRIAWSEHDALLPQTPYGSRFASLVPHAEQMVLPDVGHVPTYDAPALVVRTVLEMTGSVDRSSSGT